ncbi:DEAD/DEAH box helicase [Dermatobacter hominis]|uniref:DEAD/DEAH box helicase n=1 Tax=Dermatobacter hominis TaxID=2884263 RepID=UPI001D127564|nr:DEAD/DEAH box helicase [Dermatobacter hominis]UDY34422.1 DEAD/DEAH box helicase [Dermatobacter hominis]
MAAPSAPPPTDPEHLPSDPAPTDQDRIDALVADWSTDPRLVHVERIQGRPARLAATAQPLHPELERRLGDVPLWSHQARAIDLVRDGRSVVLATPTASGKSLCYQVPAAEAALERGATTLMVFPTKALAQDQLRTLASWDLPGVVAATYDGDCTPEERTWVRANADILLTNPEMLHHGILPNHGRWAAFLHRLELVVVDELHVLRGVFGTHTAQVLRRLRRLSETYGGSPRFVFTSATIGDPARLASELCGLDVQAITVDGSPSGARTVVLWNPEAELVGALPPDGARAAPADPSPDAGLDDAGLDHPEAGLDELDDMEAASGAVDRRWSVHAESASAAARLVAAGLRTLVFCRSRRATELVASEIRHRLPEELAPTVRSYRAGYLAEERREIEEELFSGRLRCVVATSALELGVDVGGLDAVVLSGYPGTIASFWQQVGRGGRERRPSLAVLVAGQDQLDQWMVRNPHELFGRSPEPAVINPDNPFVYVPHLACAAQEQALSRADEALWPEQLDEGVRRLVISDRASVRRRKGRRVVVWTGRGLPAPTIGLRSASRGELRIRDTEDQLIGTVEAGRAAAVVHPGAVYLHQGRPWTVVDLDLDGRTALVEPADGSVYTRTRSETSIRVLEQSDTRRVGAAGLALGAVEVTTQVVSYQTRSVRTHEVLDRTPLDLPPTDLVTRAVWYTFSDELVGGAGISDRELPGALHALEHAAIGILPLFTICDRWDVGGVSTAWLSDTGMPTVFIHDAHEGGAGIAELAFDASDRHLSATLDVIRACGCDDGCPSCVQSPKCGNGNEPLAKEAAARLLAATLGATVAADEPSAQPAS